SNTNWMLGGSYNFGAAKLYATYGASEKEILDRKKLDQTTYSVGLDLPVTKAGTVKLAYAHTETDLVTGKDTKRQTASFGYDHFLSKRTDAYAVAMYDKDDRFTANKSGTSLAVGVRHRF
ncbi:MAG: porin, partial [Comamonas sp.]|nr:porin [Candidatus Comamonas equi]